jgi:hypothetical protein
MLATGEPAPGRAESEGRGRVARGWAAWRGKGGELAAERRRRVTRERRGWLSSRCNSDLHAKSVGICAEAGVHAEAGRAISDRMACTGRALSQKALAGGLLTGEQGLSQKRSARKGAGAGLAGAGEDGCWHR